MESSIGKDLCIILFYSLLAFSIQSIKLLVCSPLQPLHPSYVVDIVEKEDNLRLLELEKKTEGGRRLLFLEGYGNPIFCLRQYILYEESTKDESDLNFYIISN